MNHISLARLKKITKKNLVCLFVEIAVCLIAGCGQASTNVDKNAAQQADTNTMAPNVVDARGHKQGHWIITSETERIPGYGAKQKVREGDYKDGKKQGVWIEYLPNNVVKDKLEFRNDTLIKVTQ
jgi:hypothetical protein